MIKFISGHCLDSLLNQTLFPIFALWQFVNEIFSNRYVSIIYVVSFHVMEILKNGKQKLT